MALPASGQITLNQVNVELGNSGTAQIDMNSAAVRGLFGIASGEIDMSDGYGKSSFDGTNWTAPQATVGSYLTHVHSSKASTTNHDEYMSLTQGNTGPPSYTTTVSGNVSSNGTTWTSDTGSVITYNASWGSVQFRTDKSHTGCPVFHDGTYWYAIGGAGNNKAIQIFRRNSSSSWTHVNNGGAGHGYCHLAKYQAGVGYFAAHVYGDIAFSTNGTSWSHYEPAFPIAYGYSFPEEIFWDSGTSKWVLFYDRGAIYGSHQNSGWAPLRTSGGSSTQGSGALFNNGIRGATTNGSGTWVAVGGGASYVPTVWKSTGGYLNWSAVHTINSTNDGSFVDVVYGAEDGVFLAVTTKNKVYSSTNGTSWSHIATTPSNKRFFWYGGKPMSVVGTTWMLRDSDGLLQVSNNAGVTWTQVGPNTSADYNMPAWNRITESEVVITNSSNQLIKSPS